MNKELEALEGLFPCSHKVCEGICKECPHKKNYNLIKSALEHKEKLEKAWKIIKKKKVCFYDISIFNNVSDYNYDMFKVFALSGKKYDPLTETEFDYLKKMSGEK